MEFGENMCIMEQRFLEREGDMTTLKKVLVYGGFVSFLAAPLFQYLGMHAVAVIMYFLFAPGYFMLMIELQRDQEHRIFEQGRASALRSMKEKVE